MTQYIGSYAISDTSNELAGMLHGTNLNKVTNLFGVFNRAARRVLEDVDPQETKVTASFGKVYNGVFDYPLFIDLKGNKVINLVPQANNNRQSDSQQVYNKDFSLWKNYTLRPTFTPNYNGAVRTLQLAANGLVSGVQINAADNVNDNGTWVNGGSASAPTQNQLFYTEGVAASVQTNLAAAGSSGYLENSTMTPANLTQAYNNNADNFLYVYLPTAANFTSLELRIGSSTAAYYELTGITTDAMGNSFVDGWNLLKVPFTSMTTVGTPNIASISYSRITFRYNGTAMNQVLINQLYSRIGVLFNMEYYSKYLFRDGATDVFKEKVTDETDYVNLDTDGYNLFLLASAFYMFQQVQGLDAAFSDEPMATSDYGRALATYRQKYRSEVIQPKTTYYYQKQATYQNYYNSNGYGGVPNG